MTTATPPLTPAWTPTPDNIKTANLSRLMARLQFTDSKQFHRWSVDSYADFWRQMLSTLGIVFQQPFSKLCDLSAGVTAPRWFPGASMNIVDSCFTAPANATALIYDTPQGNIATLSYGELQTLVNRVANSLSKLEFKSGDAIAIAMPMDRYAIAIYLGIIKMGGVVVSIADSFSSDEMAARVTIANAKAIFTQNYLVRGSKQFPLYEKIQQAQAPTAIVLACNDDPVITMRANDITWNNFLIDESHYASVACQPMAASNILFSSGTTAAPKAIVWNHTTGIKAASDAYLHQNIQAGDVLAWPTNLGWMMGPWLIFAALINKASIALYTDVPKDRTFGDFIQRARVTMLGVVPTLVASWRESRCMEQIDWTHIKVFSSTGECSNPDDMRYLMSLAGNKPVIEYCGGTEIGGAYVSSTVIEPNYPSLFSTPTMGLDFIILDEHGKPADIGEVALIPPSIGLATELLNADQYKVYYQDMPIAPDGRVLRRHGDQVMRLPNGYYTILGRVDDTMNLGGIKISAAEIERALTGIPHITENAAIAITPPNNGPSLLVIYAVTSNALDKDATKRTMQTYINQRINPLFKIHDVVLVRDLPKTASNKIMRRVLRDIYQQK